MTDLKQKAREYAQEECATISTEHLRGYVAQHYEAGYREALAPLTQEEEGKLADVLFDDLCPGIRRTELDEAVYRQAVHKAFSALCRLRGIEP